MDKAEQAVPDAEILAFATSQHRAVLTLNRKHFIRLHHEQPDHAGIVVCTLDIDFGGQAERIQAALAAQGSMRGRLVRVNRAA